MSGKLKELALYIFVCISNAVLMIGGGVLAIMLAYALMGCAAKPIVETKPIAVVVPGVTTYKPVPPELLHKCGDAPKDLSGKPTNGELLQHDRAVWAFVSCQQSVIDAIGRLQ